MEVQPSLVLLQKTLLNIEGLGRQLYPDLNLWDTAQPFLEDWVQQRYSPQSVFKRLQRHAPSWIEQLPQLPEAVLESLQQGRNPDRPPVGATPVRGDSARQTQDLTTRRRRWLAAVSAGFAVALAVPAASQYLLHAPLASWGLLSIALYLLWPRHR